MPSFRAFLDRVDVDLYRLLQAMLLMKLYDLHERGVDEVFVTLDKVLRDVVLPQLAVYLAVCIVTAESLEQLLDFYYIGTACRSEGKVQRWDLMGKYLMDSVRCPMSSFWKDCRAVSCRLIWLLNSVARCAILKSHRLGVFLSSYKLFHLMKIFLKSRRNFRVCSDRIS